MSHPKGHSMLQLSGSSGGHSLHASAKKLRGRSSRSFFFSVVVESHLYSRFLHVVAWEQGGEQNALIIPAESTTPLPSSPSWRPSIRRLSNAPSSTSTLAKRLMPSLSSSFSALLSSPTATCIGLRSEISTPCLTNQPRDIKTWTLLSRLQVRMRSPGVPHHRQVTT